MALQTFSTGFAMTDKELLELAAKAAGKLINHWRKGHLGKFDNGQGFVQNDGRIWNPLTNDGDALRLAVKLNLYVEVDKGNTLIGNVSWHEEGIASGYQHKGDPYAATRQAIVRAAAEIGKTL
jgi:hypothetical protein